MTPQQSIEIDAIHLGRVRCLSHLALMNSQQRLEIAALEPVQSLAASDRVGLLTIDSDVIGGFIRLGEGLWLLEDQAPLQVIAELTDVSGPSGIFTTARRKYRSGRKCPEFTAARRSWFVAAMIRTSTG